MRFLFRVFVVFDDRQKTELKTIKTLERDRDKNFFTRKRLLSIIERTSSSASDLADRIKTSVSTHMHNAPPSDDITTLAVQRLSQK